MKVIFGVVFYLAVVSVSFASVQVLPRTSIKPVIDGNLNDTMWLDAKKISLCHSYAGTLVNNTEALVTFDEQRLYIAFKCYENQMDKMAKIWNHVEERDNGIWADDCVEIFIDPLASNTNYYYHLIINSSSVVFDEGNGKISWDADIDVATRYDKDYWTVEMSISLLDFGYIPRGGEIWRMNLCRDEKPSKETSAIKSTGWYCNPANFEDFQFASIGAEPVKVVVQSLAVKGESDLKLKISNDKSQPVSLDVSLLVFSKGKNISSEKKRIEIKENSENAIIIPYKFLTDAQELELKVLEDDKVVYSNLFKIYPPVDVLAASGQSGKVWNIKAPLYEELLTDKPMKLAKQGAMYWFVERDYNGMRKFGMQYGIRYSHDEAYQILADNNLCPFAHSLSFGEKYDAAKYDRKHGVKEIYRADWRNAPVPKVGIYPFLLDPIAKKVYMDDIRDALTKYHDVIWAVMAGDEIHTIIANEGIDVFGQKKDEYPYIVEVDKQIKEQFGNGKYGIPSSVKGKDPLSWLAYRQWINRELDKFQEEIHAMVKKDWPDVLVISYDPISAGQPYDFSRWKSSCDIITHQLYPGGSSDRASFGYITKLVKDISGTEEFWPCLHVEEYCDSYTPQEALGLISEAYRNGATGIHYYLRDTIGVRNKSKYLWTEYYGAPDRWQVEMAVVANSAKLRQLKFPDPDFAILFSCDSYNAFPPEGRTENVESAYTLLGPKTGGWFRFINDYQIDRDEIDLSSFKAVYIPYAKYERRSVVTKLQEYVANGGILISTDPEVFAFDTNGIDSSLERQKIFGVRKLDDCRVRNIQYKQDVLPVAGRAVEVNTVSGSDIIAVFENKKPAIISCKYGKGKTFYFAANPFTYKGLESDEWAGFFGDFQKSLNIQLGQDIWRFKLPEDLIKPLPQPAGKCLTNNHILWRQFKAHKDFNIDTKGSYCYSVAPDEIGEQFPMEKLSFASGDLTDRTQAPGAGNVDMGKSNIKDWIVKYSKVKVEPFDITFDFNQQFDISKLVIYYSGQLPRVVVATSNDGRNWQSYDKVIDKTSFTEDVFDVEIDGISSKARYMKVSFDSREVGNSLTLAEIEVWAK